MTYVYRFYGNETEQVKELEMRTGINSLPMLEPVKGNYIRHLGNTYRINAIMFDVSNRITFVMCMHHPDFMI